MTPAAKRWFSALRPSDSDLAGVMAVLMCALMSETVFSAPAQAMVLSSSVSHKPPPFLVPCVRSRRPQESVRRRLAPWMSV